MASQPLSLGSPAPSFELKEPLTGKIWKLDDFKDSPALLVMFICNHCPYVVHLKEALVAFANEYKPKGLALVGICANSIKTHPKDGPEFMAAEAETFGYPFPYLYDETQEVAKAYGAVCTPDLFLFQKVGENFILAYHGQFDDSTPRNGKPVSGKAMRSAVECVLQDKPIDFEPKPCIGCSIKWHPRC